MNGYDRGLLAEFDPKGLEKVEKALASADERLLGEDAQAAGEGCVKAEELLLAAVERAEKAREPFVPLFELRDAILARLDSAAKSYAPDLHAEFTRFMEEGQKALHAERFVETGELFRAAKAKLLEIDATIRPRRRKAIGYTALAAGMLTAGLTGTGWAFMGADANLLDIVFLMIMPGAVAAVLLAWIGAGGLSCGLATTSMRVGAAVEGILAVLVVLRSVIGLDSVSLAVVCCVVSLVAIALVATPRDRGLRAWGKITLKAVCFLAAGVTASVSVCLILCGYVLLLDEFLHVRIGVFGWGISVGVGAGLLYGVLRIWHGRHRWVARLVIHGLGWAVVLGPSTWIALHLTWGTKFGGRGDRAVLFGLIVGTLVAVPIAALVSALDRALRTPREVDGEVPASREA